MPKKNILVITPFPLYPDNSGGRMGILSSIIPLSDEYNYHLLAIASAEEFKQFENDRISLLKQYYKVFKTITFVDRPEIPCNMRGKFSKLKHYLKHIILGLPLMDVSYYSEDVIKEIKKINKIRHIDLLEVHHLHMAYVKRFFKKMPAILINHNLETKLWPFWINENGGIFTFILKVIRKFNRYYGNRIEMNNGLRFDANAYVSQDEMKVVNFENNKYWLPTSFELLNTKKIFNKKRLKLLWLGGFDWGPNVDACTWFLREIWPLVSSLDIEVHLIGKNPSEDLLKANDNKKVFVHGFVEDITEYLSDSDMFIVPLREGGGIRVKILEAMNWGIPVISTSKGCEGLPYSYGGNILVANTATEFAECINQLYKSQTLKEELSKNGRIYLKENHSREVIGNKKREIYNHVFSKWY